MRMGFRTLATCAAMYFNVASAAAQGKSMTLADVLARAHELAVVSHHERAAFEQMLRVEMMRQGLWSEESAKMQVKRYVTASR